MCNPPEHKLWGYKENLHESLKKQNPSKTAALCDENIFSHAKQQQHYYYSTRKHINIMQQSPSLFKTPPLTGTVLRVLLVLRMEVVNRIRHNILRVHCFLQINNNKMSTLKTQSPTMIPRHSPSNYSKSTASSPTVHSGHSCTPARTPDTGTRTAAQSRQTASPGR